MIFTFFRNLIFLSFVTLFSGCSTISEKLDIVGIIDKTESLIFGDDDNQDLDNKKDSNLETTQQQQVQESFPDIADVPQDRPEIPEIDKSFFEGEYQEDIQDINKIISSEDKNVESEEFIDAVTNPEVDGTTPTVSAISKIAYNMRLKVKSLLAYSDPPTDMTKKNTSEKKMYKNESQYSEETKLAIIQFPNNSTTPDSSAEQVIEEIFRLYKNSKLMLIGHASSLGGNTTEGKKINMEISFARAEKIKKMLITRGYSKDSIFIEARGDLEPLDDVSQNYGEAANRRVEIFFIPE